jgi:hypothetical protein
LKYLSTKYEPNSRFERKNQSIKENEYFKNELRKCEKYKKFKLETLPSLLPLFYSGSWKLKS